MATLAYLLLILVLANRKIISTCFGGTLKFEIRQYAKFCMYLGEISFSHSCDCIPPGAGIRKYLVSRSTAFNSKHNLLVYNRSKVHWCSKNMEINYRKLKINCILNVPLLCNNKCKIYENNFFFKTI